MAVLVLLLGCILVFPKYILQLDLESGTLTAEKRVEATNNIRTTLLQAFGGISVLVGIAVSFIGVLSNKRQQQNAYTAEQINHAITHLRAPEEYARLAAIWALERIARDSKADRRVVADILLSYREMQEVASGQSSFRPTEHEALSRVLIVAGAIEPRFSRRPWVPPP
jgi:hypothetical protein